MPKLREALCLLASLQTPACHHCSGLRLSPHHPASFRVSHAAVSTDPLQEVPCLATGRTLDGGRNVSAHISGKIGELCGAL